MTHRTPLQARLPQLSASGKYLTDPDGNVVILRGFNLCSKTAQTVEQLGFDIRNARFMKECGVSVVRLGVPWANVQPYLVCDESGALQYDMQFLASIKRTIQLLADAGIYTLVDFHQDAYSVPWGFGAPSWAIVTGGTNTTNLAWPINTFGSGGGIRYVIPGSMYPPGTAIETDLNTAFDSFWENKPIPTLPINNPSQSYTLLETYGAMLKYVSAYLSDQAGNILGYDPLNEPEPGSQWSEGYIAPSSGDPNPFNFANGYPNFDANTLGVFYQECAIPSLRAGHPDAMIWFEPNIYFDYNAPTSLPDLTPAGNVGFNFHNYDSTASSANRFLDPVNNALTYQSSYTLPLLCSEFGGTNIIADIQAVADINDANMLSAIFWAWCNNARYNFFPNISPTTGDPVPTDPRAMGVVQLMSERLEPPNLNQAMLDVLTRVYPRVIAGTPISFSSQNGTFSFEYSTTLPNGQPGTGATVIVVPAALYPYGFAVSAPGTTVTQLEGIVELVVDSPAPATISVEISPNAAPLSAPSQD